eukprot:5537275-Prymnesium_polylepis.1
MNAARRGFVAAHAATRTAFSAAPPGVATLCGSWATARTIVAFVSCVAPLSSVFGGTPMAEMAAADATSVRSTVGLPNARRSGAGLRGRRRSSVRSLRSIRRSRRYATTRPTPPARKTTACLYGSETRTVSLCDKERSTIEEFDTRVLDEMKRCVDTVPWGV